jgi:outer membrane immunogenic protein
LPQALSSSQRAVLPSRLISPLRLLCLRPRPFIAGGWYVGGNLGAGFGHATTNFNAAPVGVTPAGSDTQYPSGFTGGGQIGYNWQYSPLIVVGLEADFQGAAESDSDNLSQPFHLGAVTGTALTNYTTKIDWFGTVRGRIGYVWGNGQLLSYVIGG